MNAGVGSRLGPYTIVAPLGAGGMGEVYRATDTRLKRQVAIKILPAALAADPDRLARFQREAEVLASLNHPHIAAIYGLEETAPAASGGAPLRALVMELVEGPTLADRIAQGPIGIDEAVAIARQIAEALEAAHEQGIIHRDLKPANIKVRDDGTVKVLDFGLAKLSDSAQASQGDPSDSPTITSAAMTGMGVILGTAAYMSPEQARGRAVDKRTDVWAFGAVLYEMLTRARAFPGEDIAETIASVVKSTPDWSVLRADVPPHVVTLIQRCLDKDKRSRIGDMAVARFLLSEGGGSREPSAVTPAPALVAPKWRQLAPWIAAALVTGALLGWLMPRASTLPTVVRLETGTAPAEALSGSPYSIRPTRNAIAISPDGHTLAFVAMRANTTHLYVRALNDVEARALAGTEGANGPFFSPDGTQVGFWVGRTLKKVPTAGGPPTSIAEVPSLGREAASWAPDGTIYVGSASQDQIARVSSGGGAVAGVTAPDEGKHERHLLPHVLPDGRGLLFTSLLGEDWETAKIVVRSLDNGEERVIIPSGADAHYVTTGHIVYMKTGTLMAVPFDLGSRQVTGAPVGLVDDVMQSVNLSNTDDEGGAGQFAVSNSGTLVYAVGGMTPLYSTKLMWVDRKGAGRPLPTPAAPYVSVRLSPDGKRIAASVRRGATSRTNDLWIYDVERGSPTRLTSEGGDFPVWSPDGKRVAFAFPNLQVMNSDGSGKAEPLVASGTQFPSSWAEKTNTLSFFDYLPGGSRGLWTLPVDDRPAKPRLFLETKFAVWHPELSPDGQLMAYVSNESGSYAVYVQPFPGPGEKTRISTGQGMDPLWTPDGRELIYRSFSPDSLKQSFFSVAVRSVSPFRFDAPRLLFESSATEFYASGMPNRSWAISPDGQRFLLQLFSGNVADKPVTTLRVVLNWTEELTRLVRPR